MATVCLLLLLITMITAMEESMYMERAGVKDQASSASAYSYQIQSGPPLPILLQKQNLEIEHDNGEIPHLVQGVNYFIHPQHLGIKEEKALSNFEKGGGSAYNEASDSAKGEKGSSGYLTKHAYDKGAKGQHDKEQHSGHYNKEGGDKSAHHDEGGYYGGKHEEGKGAHGETYSEKSSKKKGSKTTGFHRVHHKDEYKKDHSFYDESHNSGNHEKYGDYYAKHAGEHGGYEKGKKFDGGYKAQEFGEKGGHDKGKYLQEDSGFKGQEGEESYYKDAAEYAKKGGNDEGKEYGYSEGDKFIK